MAKRVSLKGKGADLFFGDLPAPQASPPAGGSEEAAPEAISAEPLRSMAATVATAAPGEATPAGATTPPPAAPPRARTSRGGSRPPVNAGQHAGAVASKLASTLSVAEGEEIEAIRQVVKTPGREVSFVRLSPEEKGDLADVVYTYKRQGLKTTENEINRIAINVILADHRANGDASLLARVLAALRA